MRDHHGAEQVSGGLVRSHAQGALPGAGTRREHDAVGNAGAGRLLAIVVGDGHFARRCLQAPQRILADANTERNEGAESAVDLLAERDPLLAGLRLRVEREA